MFGLKYTCFVVLLGRNQKPLDQEDQIAAAMAVGGADKEDDDDFELFGDDNEEDEEAVPVEGTADQPVEVYMSKVVRPALY